MESTQKHGSRQRFTHEELRQFRDDLREIQRVARRKRLLGDADPALEAGCTILSARLRRMEREARK